jgi:hypothetical protein
LPLRRSQSRESTSRCCLLPGIRFRPLPDVACARSRRLACACASASPVALAQTCVWTWLRSPHSPMRWPVPGQSLLLSLPLRPWLLPGSPASPRRGVPRPLRSASAVSHDSDGLLLSGPGGFFHPLTPLGFFVPAPRLLFRSAAPRTNRTPHGGEATVQEAPSRTRPVFAWATNRTDHRSHRLDDGSGLASLVRSSGGLSAASSLLRTVVRLPRSSGIPPEKPLRRNTPQPVRPTSLQGLPLSHMPTSNHVLPPFQAGSSRERILSDPLAPLTNLLSDFCQLRLPTLPSAALPRRPGGHH